MNFKTLSLVMAESAGVSQYSDTIDLGVEGCGGSLGVQAAVTVSTPAAQLFASTAVDTSADTVAVPSHGYVTGVKGQLTTTGVLPAGLSLATDYFIIAVDADTIAFATSYANAVAGTKVDMTDQGSGNDTFTATSAAGTTVTLQQSNDNSTFGDVAAATSITTTGSYFIAKQNPEYRYYRLKYVLTAGTLASTNLVFLKNNVD